MILFPAAKATAHQWWFLASLFLTTVIVNVVNAQDTIFACDILRETDCQTCMVNGTSCVFAAGECFDECTQDPVTGASCYSKQSHPELTATGICELYDTDNAQCTSQTSCSSCLATVKSDLQSCQWYPTAFEGLGACFGGGEGPFGPGQMTCEGDDGDTTTGTTEAPTAAETPAATTPVPTVASTTAATDPPTAATVTDPPMTDPPTAATTTATTEPPVATDPVATPSSVCQAAGANCDSCLEAACAWFPEVGACESTCMDLADTSCYSASTFPDLTGLQMCEQALVAAQDRELCFAQDNCSVCLETTKTDGAACQWYTDDSTGLEWCQTGGCNMEGICGSDTCTVVDDSGMDGGGMTPMDNTTGTGTATNGGGPCSEYNDLGLAEACSSCLSSEHNCAWSVNTCMDSCDNMMVATDGEEDAATDEEVPCYHADANNTINVEATCELAMDMALDMAEEDAKLCGRKNYCFTCTSTIQSDGVTPCAWYQDTISGREWCDVGGCNEDGVCGVTDESVCQVPTETPGVAPPGDTTANTPAPADIPVPAETSSAFSPSQQYTSLTMNIVVGSGLAIIFLAM